MALVACAPVEERYEAEKLPPEVKVAVLRVQSKIGTLRVEYADGRVITSEGRIENLPQPRSFAVLRNSTDDQFAQYDFVWNLEGNSWSCTLCLKGVQRPVASQVKWRLR